jgi:hypothetical protein
VTSPPVSFDPVPADPAADDLSSRLSVLYKSDVQYSDNNVVQCTATTDAWLSGARLPLPRPHMKVVVEKRATNTTARCTVGLAAAAPPGVKLSVSSEELRGAQSSSHADLEWKSID